MKKGRTEKRRLEFELFSYSNTSNVIYRFPILRIIVVKVVLYSTQNTSGEF